MKKISITGHTKGIGKAIYNSFSKDEIIGFSRTNGYDISENKGRNKIIEESKDCNIFINNAYHTIFQVELLYELFKEWENERKLIINIGSNTTDGIYPRIWPYSSYKVALEKACEQLTAMDKECKVTMLKFGFVGTDKILQNFKLKKYLEVSDIVSCIKYIIDIHCNYDFEISILKLHK